MQFIPPFRQFVARRLAATRALRYGVLHQQHTHGRRMPHWNNDLPIYRQLAGHLAVQLLDGDPPEGEAMPSVRTLASQYVINPLTVTRALQSLVDEGLVESRRGLGMYVQPGARRRLLQAERARFLNEEWPLIVARLRRLGIKPQDLDWEQQ